MLISLTSCIFTSLSKTEQGHASKNISYVSVTWKKCTYTYPAGCDISVAKEQLPATSEEAEIRATAEKSLKLRTC